MSDAQRIDTLGREAVALQRAGAYAEAVVRYRRILEFAPGLAIARDNLCLALLGAGDYAQGLPMYDLRFERAVGRVAKPDLPFPEWRGEPVAGRSILIWAEQGLGDMIMFARFAKLLAEQGARVTLVAHPPLARLFGHLPLRVLELAARMEIPRHDAWVMAMSIPGRLELTAETIPNAPYLPSADQGHGIGLALRGDPRNPLTPFRTPPGALIQELMDLPGAVSLLPEDSGAKDFEDTRRIVEGLDLVISIDTSATHLAGAMGKPAWVLLPAENCDWRWMSGRDDSPWYPSVRLFRQSKPGDWRDVVDRVKAAALAR